MTLRKNPLSYVSPVHVGPTCDGEMGLVHLKKKKKKLLYYETHISLIYKSCGLRLTYHLIVGLMHLIKDIYFFNWLIVDIVFHIRYWSKLKYNI